MRKVLLASGSAVFALLTVAVLWKGGKALDVVWVLALVSGTVTLLSLRKPETSLPVPVGFGLALLAYVLWTVLSFVFSETRNYGFDELLQSLSLALLCLYAARQFLENPFFAVRFSKILSGSLLIACGVGLVVYVLQPVSRFSGTFFDYRFHTDYWPNAWAEFVLLSWPVLVWTLFLRPVRRMPRTLDRDWIKSVLLGIVFGCLALSFSRGGFIAFAGEFAMLCVASVLSLGRSAPWKRCVSVMLLSVVTASLTFVAANHVRSKFHAVESLERKITFSSDEGASSISERKDFWVQSFSLALDRPFFGFGPYSFRFVQPHLQSEILATSDHPHNVFLKLASERGFPAAALFLVILTYVAYFGIKPYFKTGKAQVPSLRTFFVVAVAGVIAHNLIDYNLQFVGIALPLWLMIGMIVSRPSPRASRVFYGLLLLASSALLFISFYEGVNLALSSRARHAETRGDPYAALRWYSWIDASIFPRDARLAQSAILLSLKQLPQAEDAVNKYITSNPEDGRAWRLLGDIYLKWNKRNDGLRAYEKAYQFSRYNDAGILRGLIYLQEDVDREILIERRSEFDALINDFGLAIQQNTHFIDLGSNVEELVSACDLMGRYFPEDKSLYRSLAKASMEHAKAERQRTASRPRGLLW